MSSSKIIKQVDHDKTGVTEFNFRTIVPGGVAHTESHDSGHFVPLGALYGFDQDAAGRNAADAGPPPVEISEIELNQRIDDSFNAGLKEGKELAERGLINVFRALRASSETIHNLRDKIFRESEDELINMIMLVARKVILREVSQDRSIVTGVVKNALAGLFAREEITVRINPDDYLLATSGRDELLLNELLTERLLLKPDPLVPSGFCLIDTDMGTIDASLDGQIEQIYRSLLEQRTTAAIEEP
jgi:flagellar assembly protein FliH